MNLIYVSIFHTLLNLLAPRIYPQLCKGCSQDLQSILSEGSTITRDQSAQLYQPLQDPEMTGVLMFHPDSSEAVIYHVENSVQNYVKTVIKAVYCT